MTSKDLHDIAKLLMDLHFVQANSLVGAGLQNNKDALKYMARIGELREIVKLEAGIKDKNT